MLTEDGLIRALRSVPADGDPGYPADLVEWAWQAVEEIDRLRAVEKESGRLRDVGTCSLCRTSFVSPAGRCPTCFPAHTHRLPATLQGFREERERLEGG